MDFENLSSLFDSHSYSQNYDDDLESLNEKLCLSNEALPYFEGLFQSENETLKFDSSFNNDSDVMSTMAVEPFLSNLELDVSFKESSLPSIFNDILCNDVVGSQSQPTNIYQNPILNGDYWRSKRRKRALSSSSFNELCVNPEEIIETFQSVKQNISIQNTDENIESPNKCALEVSTNLKSSAFESILINEEKSCVEGSGAAVVEHFVGNSENAEKNETSFCFTGFDKPESFFLTQRKSLKNNKGQNPYLKTKILKEVPIPKTIKLKKVKTEMKVTPMMREIIQRKKMEKSQLAVEKDRVIQPVRAKVKREIVVKKEVVVPYVEKDEVTEPVKTVKKERIAVSTLEQDEIIEPVKTVKKEKIAVSAPVYNKVPDYFCHDSNLWRKPKKKLKQKKSPYIKRRITRIIPQKDLPNDKTVVSDNYDKKVIEKFNSKDKITVDSRYDKIIENCKDRVLDYVKASLKTYCENAILNSCTEFEIVEDVRKDSGVESGGTSDTSSSPVQESGAVNETTYTRLPEYFISNAIISNEINCSKDELTATVSPACVETVKLEPVCVDPVEFKPTCHDGMKREPADDEKREPTCDGTMELKFTCSSPMKLNEPICDDTAKIEFICNGTTEAACNAAIKPNDCTTDALSDAGPITEAEITACEEAPTPQSVDGQKENESNAVAEQDVKAKKKLKLSEYKNRVKDHNENVADARSKRSHDSVNFKKQNTANNSSEKNGPKSVSNEEKSLSSPLNRNETDEVVECNKNEEKEEGEIDDSEIIEIDLVDSDDDDENIKADETGMPSEKLEIIDKLPQTSIGRVVYNVPKKRGRVSVKPKSDESETTESKSSRKSRKKVKKSQSNNHRKRHRRTSYKPYKSRRSWSLSSVSSVTSIASESSDASIKSISSCSRSTSCSSSSSSSENLKSAIYQSRKNKFTSHSKKSRSPKSHFRKSGTHSSHLKKSKFHSSHSRKSKANTLTLDRKPSGYFDNSKSSAITSQDKYEDNTYCYDNSRNRLRDSWTDARFAYCNAASSYSPYSSKSSYYDESSPFRGYSAERYEDDQNFVTAKNRKIIYIAGIGEETMMKEKLKKRFGKFGVIKDVSIFIRDIGINYAFVTYESSSSAYDAIERGNDDPKLPKYDIKFGGRRNFCYTNYQDLDSHPTRRRNKYSDSRSSKEPADFDTLLKMEVKARALSS